METQIAHLDLLARSLAILTPDQRFVIAAAYHGHPDADTALALSLWRGKLYDTERVKTIRRTARRKIRRAVMTMAEVAAA